MQDMKTSDNEQSQDPTKNKPLRKQVYSNVLKVLQPKKEKFQIKKSDIVPISAQNIDCGQRF